MPDDTDRADGVDDLDRLLEGGLDGTAVLRCDDPAPDVVVLPVEDLPAHGSRIDRLETLAATVDDRNQEIRALVRTLERQQALLADLTARIGDLEARLEGIASGED